MKKNISAILLALLWLSVAHAPPTIVDICMASGIDNTGATDSDAPLVTALNSLAGSGNVGSINCAIWPKMVLDASKAIFVRNGTNLTFGPNGRFKVDNTLFPAFSFLNTTNSTWTNPQFEYIGNEPLDPTVAPYAGVGGTFNDTYAKAELVRQGYSFSGGGSNLYTGLANQAATIMIRGSANNLVFTNPRFYVAPNTNAAHFMPVAVSWDPEWKCCSVTTNSGPINSSTANAPTNILFDGPVLDGVYMGFVTDFGGTVTINNARGLRYSDLQDESGGTQGGVAHWFPPPHFIYLQDGDVSFHNHYTLNQTKDYGKYVGGNLRRTANSGTLVSMKLALTNGTAVNGYFTGRPDGCADMIANFTGATTGQINDMYCVYDSTTPTVDGTPIWGLRFPSTNPYVHVKFAKYTIEDTAASPVHFPVNNIGNASNNDITFSDFNIYQNHKTGPFPSIAGANIHSSMTLHIASCTGGRPAGGTNNPGVVLGC